MALKEKDIKKIWGLSGGICAKCKTELFKDDEIIGEQAHCIARKDKNLLKKRIDMKIYYFFVPLATKRLKIGVQKNC